MILDLFAGPGGWSEGLRLLGLADIGIEWDAAACLTRAAAGHLTIRADVEQYPTAPFAGKAKGLIMSPPCPDFSTAGKGAGIEGESGRLIAQVPRWALALRPEWIVCEQVPPALPYWQEYAYQLDLAGYSTWAGVLCAADFGVPQTRRRAILMASRVRPVSPPEPTHGRDPVPGLFGTLAPWVTMADALGWADVEVNLARGAGMIERHGDRPGRTDTQPNRRTYGLDEPAPTVAFGNDAASWCWELPATTVAGDPRITARCHHEHGDQGRGAVAVADVAAGRYDGTAPDPPHAPRRPDPSVVPPRLPRVRVPDEAVRAGRQRRPAVACPGGRRRGHRSRRVKGPWAQAHRRRCTRCGQWATGTTSTPAAAPAAHHTNPQHPPRRNQLMELTLADLRSLIAPPTETAPSTETTTADPLDPKPGDQLIIRTVTMTLTGQVVACSPTWIMLDSAAWIADSGRWADAIVDGTLSEVEPMGDGVRVARAAIVDVTPWRHPLPTVQQ